MTEETEASEENQGAAGAAARGKVADPSRLRLSQDFAAAIGVKKALLTVPVRKPTRQEFVRVHPDPAYRMQIALIELRDEGEVYAVEQGLCAELPGEVIPKVLLTTITKQGVVLLWPIACRARMVGWTPGTARRSTPPTSRPRSGSRWCRTAPSAPTTSLRRPGI